MFVKRARAAAATLALLGFYVSSAAGQTPLWADEFDGPGIDYGHWTFDVGGGGFGNGELQYHTARPQNAYIENGSLVIEARRENYSGRQFTSARLKSHGRMAFKYGTLEARIKVPNLQNGLWPAFWLLGDNLAQQTWPKCGEIDILEMGTGAAIADGTVNRRVSSAGHWDYQNNHAQYGTDIVRPTNQYNDYHILRLEWTPTTIRTLIDGVQIWIFNISGGEASSLEEFHRPYFIVANLSVGGSNFVGITDPAQITAPFPAKMYIDYIRLYDNGYTELFTGEDTAQTGNFGILTETTPVDDSVDFGSDASLYIWNNLTPGSTAPQEGAEAWSMTAAAGAWFGMGVYSHVNRNLQNYSDGALKFHMKTTGSATFRVGVASAAAGEGWVTFSPTGESFGLVRDGAWHQVTIPASRFGNVDFNTLVQLFMMAGDAPASAFNFAIDNLYWSPNVPRPTPQHGAYGIFTETAAHKTAGEYQLGVDGQFYIWENTLVAAGQQPYEGAGSMSLASAPGLTWFGAAFTPTVKLNLTAFRYPESRLHLALRTSSTATFQLGMKSGTVNDIGQQWITFANGSDPYGFVRDGQWHVLEIPMSDFAAGVDLSQVSQLFELLGVNGPISGIEFDDVCLLGGGAALTDGSDVPGDLDGDGDVDLNDAALFVDCLSGPDGAQIPASCSAAEFAASDLDLDDDVDLYDFGVLSELLAQ